LPRLNSTWSRGREIRAKQNSLEANSRLKLRFRRASAEVAYPDTLKLNKISPPNEKLQWKK